MLLSKFLRFFFRLLYHQFAWTYDLVAAVVSLGQWKTWVSSVLPYLKGPRVLELGHGPGHLQVALHNRRIQVLGLDESHDRGLQVFGLDESRHMGRQAYHRLIRSGKHPNLINGYAQKMPFTSAAFDQIVATFPSEYIAQPQTLHEVVRLLRPGGELLLLPLAWITSPKFPYRLAAWLFRLTGQAPAAQSLLQPETLPLEPFGRPFREAGFSVEIEWLHLPNSTLLLVHAYRPITGPA